MAEGEEVSMKETVVMGTKSFLPLVVSSFHVRPSELQSLNVCCGMLQMHSL